MDNNLGEVLLVKDIDPSNFGSSPYDFIEFNGKLYFSADDGENGRELWVSDGTSEGTELVADINPGSDGNYNYDSDPSNFIEFNGKLYFSADDGENGRELWVSDGTSEGTELVADINPGSDGSYNYSFSSGGFIEFNEKLYFLADDGENGDELWVSDGTSEGTELVADINPGSGFFDPFDSEPRYFIEFNEKLYFTADDGENGNELWISDGTSEGTELVADINPSSDGSYGYGSYSRDFIEFKEKLYFSADNNENGDELWVSDGTSEGTKLVADINPNFVYSYPEGDRLFGRDSKPRYFIEFNGKLYFTADDGENGNELWVSDGTSEGTELLTDINPGSGSSYPTGFTEFDGKLYFAADDGENGTELFVTNGTVEGTELLTDINPGLGSSDPNSFTEFNGKLYFAADNGDNGTELFVTDGTAEGTQLVADLNPGTYDDFGYVSPSSSFPNDFIVFGDELFFNANNGQVGDELFKLTFDGDGDVDDDGTITQPLKPIAGTSGDDNLTGTDANDEISSQGGNDGITGGLGNDLLKGQSGNDVLDGGAGTDTLNGGAGVDTVVYQFDPAGVTVDLNAGTATDGYGDSDSLNNLENVIGSDFADNLTGNSSDNSLAGRSGDDSILGGDGADLITGSDGADTLGGGAGNDRFIYLNANEGGDTISDFSVGSDRILVVSGVFGGGLTAGTLATDNFVIGSAASNSDRRFVFNDDSGELFFDLDGNGTSEQKLLARLDGVSGFSAGDIQLL